MTRHLTLRGLAISCVTALAFGLVSAIPTHDVHAADDDLGCPESLVQKKLKNGAAWRMCARIDDIKGLVLEKIEFAPASGVREYSGYKRVIDSLYLSQLNVPYDNGETQFNDITSYGFGGPFLMPQVAELCHGDTITISQSTSHGSQLIERDIPAICTDEVATGLSTHAQEAQLATGPRFIAQGTAFEVSSVSKISWYEYQQKVTFGDDGSIDVGLGATGDLAQGTPGSTFFSTDPAAGWPIGSTVNGQDYYSTSHWHNAIYRVDFGIDSGSTQAVEQWDYESVGSGESPKIAGTGTQKSEAFHAIVGDGNDDLSWWRVSNPESLNKDGHARSYEIVNRSVADPFIPVTQPIVSFTNANDCQEYASDNLSPDCPNQNVLDYVAGDEAALDDPVAWINVGFHHIVRDEDQSPMPVHWQRFQLVPRDFFAQSPSAPDERQCINGPDTTTMDSLNRPCIARNSYRPRIAASTTTVEPGTVLSSSTGIWITNRTTWNYSYMWFRDGEPIIGEDQSGEDQSGEPVPAIGSQYVVTQADEGTSITVKVTASQTGFGSGTAESLPTPVAGGPSPTPTSPTATTPIPTTPTTTAAPDPALVLSTTIGKLVKSKLTKKQNAYVKVTVKAPGLSPTGRFQIRDGSKILRTGTLKNGKAKIKLPKFKKARTYHLRVVYLGTSKVKQSQSKPMKLTVTRK